MSAWKIFEETDLYFLTSTITDWIHVFVNNSYFNSIIESLEYCRKHKGLRIHAYVIMLNHIHLIVSVEQTSSQNLSDILRDFKRFTSKKITDHLKEEGNYMALNTFTEAAVDQSRGNNFKVWQDGFHPKAILNEKFCRQKLEYIRLNPVKKGYVIKPEHWCYSSAGYYSGMINIPLQIDNIFEFKK